MTFKIEKVDDDMLDVFHHLEINFSLQRGSMDLTYHADGSGVLTIQNEEGEVVLHREDGLYQHKIEYIEEAIYKKERELHFLKSCLGRLKKTTQESLGEKLTGIKQKEKRYPNINWKPFLNDKEWHNLARFGRYKHFSLKRFEQCLRTKAAKKELAKIKGKIPVNIIRQRAHSAVENFRKQKGYYPVWI